MMKVTRLGLGGLVLLLSASASLLAKSPTIDNGAFTKNDKEYYLTPEEIYFIRPGLDLEILNTVIPADLQPLVTFSIKDPGGLPLDINGVYTPGPVDTRFMLTYIPQGEEQKVRLTVSTRDRDGTYTSLGDGVYTYKFSTILPDLYDPDATHTLAVAGRRDLREFDLDRYVENAVSDFVPSGMYDPVARDVVATETCNGRCHDPLVMHGRYNDIRVCTQCHNPGHPRGPERAFNVLIHQVHAGGSLETPLIIGRHDYTNLVFPAELNDCETCHTGGTPTENFPLVANPAAALVCDMSGTGETTLNWQHTGNVEIQVRSTNNQTGNIFARGGATGSVTTGKWVKDGTVFDLYDADTNTLVQSVPVNATVLGCVTNPPGTFVGRAAAQHTNWMDHPSRLICGSCHDDVDFDTGENHPGGAFGNDEVCHFCHVPDSGNEFDHSIRGAHLPLYKSAQFPGVVVNIISVTDTNPGDTPTVTFSMASKTGSLDPAGMDRFRLAITGPNEDFSFYAQENVGNAAVAAGDYWAYTFATPLPTDAAGSYTAAWEGRVDVPIVGHEREVSLEHDNAENTTFAFAVTDLEAIPRRMVVDDVNCENCHRNRDKHGGTRHNPQYCVTCHRPDRLSNGVPASTIHFKYMIHKIHRGDDLENGFVVNRSRDRVVDFSEVRFPGDLRNCETCHVNDSYELPLPVGLLATNTPNEWWQPMQPIAAACLACHDSDSAAAHAYTNTTFFGEACANCHGEGKDLAVSKVHAR